MAEDAYRAELNHAWRMRRLDETVEAIRKLCTVIDQDITSVLESQNDIGGLE